MGITYSEMRITEYEELYALWRSIPEVRLSKADEKERIGAYLSRNPGQSFVCKADGRVVATVLCGNDGRRAFIYHLAVSPAYRRRGIATELVRLAINKQKLLGMDKCAVFILNENDTGKSFWSRVGFTAVQEAETMAKSI
ncbi:MAG TPA: GNAT family N-acetyltransferase [Clostridiales bacterium]|nr:GNAT family N-acetyltransferase [Clostridiales bacterium]